LGLVAVLAMGIPRESTESGILERLPAKNKPETTRHVPERGTARGR
jgi:hypothetical protein